MGTRALESLRRPVRQDVTAGFCSGAAELDDRFRRYAQRSQKTNNAVVYVTTQDDAILGYYVITTVIYSHDNAPQGLDHRSHPEGIPRTLLARPAVDERTQRRGAGAALLKNAIERCYRLSREMDATALIVHRRDEQARVFYLANGNFLPSSANALYLLLSMEQLSRMLGSS